MANPNVPSSEPESVLSGHTMEKARGGVAPLVTFFAATAVAGVTGVARDARADEARCGPGSFSIQNGSSSVNGMLTPLPDGRVNIEARFSERPDEPYSMVVNPPVDNCSNQRGIDVTVANARGPHLNGCGVDGNGDGTIETLHLIHVRRNTATHAREATQQTDYVMPRVCPPVASPPAPSSSTEGTGQPAGAGEATSGQRVAPPPVVVPPTPRVPNPGEIFADSPEEFRVQARYELSADRAPGKAPGSRLSPSASWRRGALRTLQFDLDQLPAPPGMDFSDDNMLVAPDGNGGLNSGLYIAVGQSIAGNEAPPYKAVYVAHVLPSSDIQNLHFDRVYPPLGSDVGSGGPPTVDFHGVLSMNRSEGDLALRPRESSDRGLRNCEAIRLADEGLEGNSPVAFICAMIGQQGRRAFYVGAPENMIGPQDVAHPDTVHILEDLRGELAIVEDRDGQRIANVDPAAEGMELPSVRALLTRMPSRGNGYSPNLRALFDDAIRNFMRRPYYERSDGGQVPEAEAPAGQPTSWLGRPVNAAPAPSGAAVPPRWFRRNGPRA